MNCNKYKKLISLYVDNRISDSHREAVLHHINECEECRNYYNLLNSMVNDLANVKEVELPEGYENKLHFALKNSKGEKAKEPVNRQT